MTREIVAFGELIKRGALEVGDGYRAKNDELGGRGPIFLRSAYLQENGFAISAPERFHSNDLAKFGRKVALIGDVAITTKGNSTGRVGCIREPQAGAVYSPHLSYWRSLELDYLDQNFLFHWSRSYEFKTQLAGMAASTDMAPYLSLRDQARLRISLPPIHYQRFAASILRALDDKIDLNRRIDEALQATARAIFKDWFVDFGPTRTKMDGRAAYLEPSLWALFPDRLNEEGNPNGWERSSLDEFMTFNGGSQPPASEFKNYASPGYVRLLQIRDFYTDRHLTFVPKTSRLRLVSEDDICIGRYGSGSGDEKDSLGRLCRGLAGAINVALVRVTPKFECKEYLATIIGSGEFRQKISGGSARAVQAGFRQEDLANIKVVRAPSSIHEAFERIGAMIWESDKQRKKENALLADTRDLLLPKLMSGQVQVQEVTNITAALT